MPIIHAPGKKVGSYTIVKELNRGAMATAYSAKSDKGETVFFKQYKSPTITVAWYKAYVEYQKELKRRVESSTFKNFSYRFVEFFEKDRCYYQVFEFVDCGASLAHVLEKGRKRPRELSWESRLLMAKVLMAGIGALHQAGIIHSDLKPENIMLIKDDSIKMGYRLKVIDMDYSILSDQHAPWHGHQGYVGTPGYFSPEHLRGERPVQHSDVFTCGLMLYELLAEAGHPYRFEDAEDYKKAALERRASRAKLLDKMLTPAKDAQVQEILYRCFSPDAADRPTAEQVNLALNGRATTPTPAPPAKAPPATPPAAPPPREVERAAAPARAASKDTTRIVLRSEDGKELRFGLSTDVGRSLCKQLGAGSEFWADPQFRLEPSDAGWYVVPMAGAKNETLLNGKKATSRTLLKEGDILGVGNEAKGSLKLPLKVGFGVE